MTLIEAINTGRPYKRGNFDWMKSEKESWFIRDVGSGSPMALSEQDIKAKDWQIDIRMPNHGYRWISTVEAWRALNATDTDLVKGL